MPTIYFVILITAISGIFGTFLGGIIGVSFKNYSKGIISLMLSFAAGIMIGIVCFDLVDDALLHSNLLVTILGILIGYIVISLADGIAVKYRFGTNKSEDLYNGGIITAIAISLHNLPEGMVIGATYTSVSYVNLISIAQLSVPIVIGLHNIPEGLTIALPIISSGKKRITALIITLLSGVPTVFGAILGYSIGTFSNMWMALCLSFASGAMIYVVFEELIPSALEMSESRLTAFTGLLGLITGLVIIMPSR